MNVQFLLKQLFFPLLVSYMILTDFALQFAFVKPFCTPKGKRKNVTLLFYDVITGGEKKHKEMSQKCRTDALLSHLSLSTQLAIVFVLLIQKKTQQMLPVTKKKKSCEIEETI